MASYKESETPIVHVSVIIPAHNAAETIADTLQSLVEQTFPDWEAIVVDDGSTDDTSDRVSKFLESDRRFRLIQQQNMGESGARNSGIKLARFDWLLFLDSDDWILPRHLERLTRVLTAAPHLDAAYCGWTYVTPDGQYIFASCGEETGDLFAEHAEYCFSIVHTYLVRRSLVDEACGFDLSLRTCADWDLWQRIARTGACFGAVPETLAVYRIRAGSATRDGYQLLADGLRVLNQGHAFDPRVLKPHPSHVNGHSKVELTRRKFELACACAGYLIGGGKEARPLLDLLQGERCLHLDAYAVASCIFKHTMVGSCQPLSEWARVWPNFADAIDDFLIALEDRSGTAGLAARAHRLFKHLMIRCGAGRELISRTRSFAMRHLVSVIIIFFNAEKFFQEAVQSVFSQTYDHWELLLVDDGSTDGSTQIALQYAQQYSDRVRYFEHAGHQNRGMSASRNLGIRHARGDYIAFLDADDVWLPSKVTQQVALLQANPEAVMLYGRTQIWYSWSDDPEDERRDYMFDLGVKPNTLVEPPALFLHFLEGDVQTPTTCNAMIRREVFEAIGGFLDTFRGMYEDQVFFAKVCLTMPVFVADACWARYRQHPDSCNAIAERKGETRTAWLPFLNWIDAYLTEQGIREPRLWEALQQQLWPYHHPVRYRIQGWYRLCVWNLKRVVRRMMPTPVYTWLQEMRQTAARKAL